MIREFEKLCREAARYLRERTRALRVERKARRKGAIAPSSSAEPKRPLDETETEDVILGDLRRQAAEWKKLADSTVEPYVPPAGAPKRKVEPPPPSREDPPSKPWEPGDGILKAIDAPSKATAPEAQETPADAADSLDIATA